MTNISIHALREEGDPSPKTRSSKTWANFYPRPPRGGRQGCKSAEEYRMTFLSTPSARRATKQQAGNNNLTINFYPRPPRGGRPGQCSHGPGAG